MWHFCHKPNTVNKRVLGSQTTNSPFVAHAYTFKRSCFFRRGCLAPTGSSVCRSGSGLSPGVLGSYSIFHYPEFAVFPRVCVLILQPVTYSLVGVTLFRGTVDTVCFFIRWRDRQIPENTSWTLRGCKQNSLAASIFFCLHMDIQISLFKWDWVVLDCCYN